MKDGIQSYEFKFKFNAKDAKKQLKSISDDVLQMIHNMDTASNKMSVFTNLVGYLEKLDGALNQFKADHKNDFANLFGDIDSQLAKSLESALGINPGKLAQLSGLRGRIDKALSDKAGVAETRKIAQDINELFTAIGRPEEINIDEWFTGTGKTASERIEKLNNALYKFYLQHQLLTSSIKNGFMSSGLNGISGLSEDAQQEVQKLSDAYDDLITMQQKLQKAQSDMDKMRSKNNKKIVEEHKIELTEESVGQLINEFDSLEKKISTGDKTSKNYYENLLKMTDVILKLNSALKTIRGDSALLTTFQGINVGGGHSHMFDKLSNYTSVKATQFESKFLGKTVEDGIKNLMSARRTQIEKILFNVAGGIGGGPGSGSGDGSGEGQVSLYKQLTENLKKYTKAYKEYKELEDSGADDDELGVKSDQIEELKDKIFTLVELSEEAYDQVDEIFSVYEGGNFNFDQLVDELTKVLKITKEINEEGGGKKLKTYDELLKIVDQLNTLSDISDFDDSSVQKLISDLKELYAVEEQLDDVDDILSNLFDGSIYDTDALNQLAKLFGIEIPDSIQTAAQKCEDFFNQVNRQKDIGLNDEFDAGQYLSKMEQLKNELQVLRDNGRLTEEKFDQIQKTFDKDVKSYVDEIINKSNVLKELNKLNQDATLTDDEASLSAIVQRRREIIALAEQNGTLLDRQLLEERAITDEIEKRIGLQKNGGKGTGSGKGGDGSGSGEGSGDGSGDASKEDEQYKQLLETIRLVEQAVKDKTAAFVEEKETVDEVVQHEIETLGRLSDALESIKETAQSLFGEKQGLVNTSVKEWQHALEAIHSTMQSISTMQSVDEMVSRLAANAQTIKNSIGDINGGKEQSVANAGASETVTKVDFTSLEGTIKSEIQSLVDKLDKTLKVEVVKSNAEEITTTIGGIQKSIDKIVKVINDYKIGNANNKQQAQIDAMKANLLQLKNVVSNFNERKVNGDYQQQEITGAIMSDGSISVGYGEKGEVPWDRVASSLVANLTKSLVVDLHSHPLKSFSNGQTYANDAFSGSKGDLSAFKFSRQLGAKFAAEITGNIMRVLDLSKLSETDMMTLSNYVDHFEREYAKNQAYSKYITYDDGKIKYKQQSTLQDQHKVTQILESIMYDAFNRMGYSRDKVDKNIFKKYDLTDDNQLTDLSSRLVQLSNASQTAIEPLERLKQIVSLFGGNLGSSEANTAFEAFTKGELSAADVFNKLNGKGHKISQETIDSLFRIDSANEIPAIESLLSQVTGILNTISTSVTSIDGKIKLNTGKQFDYALNDIMEFSGLNDVGSEITSRITSSIESQFDPSNVSEYKVKELSLSALDKAQDLINNFEYVANKNGQVSVEMTQVMLDNFTSTLRAMEDAMSQEELYRERTGQRVLNDQGKRLEDDLVTTFYATFSKENIQAMKNLLARGKEKWQAQKDSYGDSHEVKVDPVAQSVDSLTSAIGELHNVVSGLQQYITSPQFTIKADTSVLEESLSSVSTEISTGAQKIADAVSDFDRKVNSDAVGGQVSIDKHEMTMAMQEALYSKEFAANYAKVEFQDVMDYDWNLDQYANALTGEIVGTFEEADRLFDQYFANFYKSLDGSFIGDKEEAINHLIQNLPQNDDFATVIVQAIQDQTGKIVNAIKVVLPDRISSNTSGDGTIVDEKQIANAFKVIARDASSWSDANDSEPREFFNNILSGFIYMDDELKGALKTLGMLSSSGSPKFKVASEGLRNLGVAIGEDFALPSRPDELNQVYELVPLLNEATKLGAQIPRIVSSFTDANRVFELQTKMKGNNIRSSFDWIRATEEQIDGFIHTLETLNKVGLYPDFIGDNVLFDENAGFSLVDIETQPLKWGLKSAEDMGDWFVQYLRKLESRREFSGQERDIERFVDLFEYRMSLPADQRFVNEHTVAQRKNTSTTSAHVKASGLDEAIDKIVRAANAIEGFVSNFGDAVSALMNQISSGPNAEIELYDPSEHQGVKIYNPEEYQKRAVLHFGDLYDQEDEMSQNAINDLALFRREFDQLWDIMEKNPLDIYDVLNPTDAEKAQVLDIFEQIKQKNLEIANSNFTTEEDLQRIRLLKAEVIGLQNELRGAAIGIGDALDFEDNYRDIYGLGNFDASVFANYIHGNDMHSRLSDDLSEMLHNRIRRVDTWAVSDELDDALITNRDTFNKFLLEHAKRLLGEKSLFDPDDVPYEQTYDGDATYDQDSSGIVNNETEALTQLASAVSSVKEAVAQKTEAFVAEGTAVESVVGQEIAALVPLTEQLEKIQGYVSATFNGTSFDLNNASLSSLQNLLTILGNIATQLQLINTGFDTLNNTTIPGVQAQQNIAPQQKAAGDYALDTTLQGATRLIGEINSKLGTTGQLANIATALTNAATALKQIASGVAPSGGGTGSGSGSGSGGGGGQKRKTLSTDKQNLLAKDELDKQTGDASVAINKFGDETLTTTQKVGTEIVKVVKTTKNGITTTAIEMSNAYKNAMEDTYNSITGFEQEGLFGQYNQNGGQVEAQDALSEYKQTYTDLSAEIKKFEADFKAGLDTTKTQSNIDRLQTKLDGLEGKLIGIAKHSKAFLDSGTTFGAFTQDELNDSGNALKKLVVNSEQLAVAFRGVHEDGRKVIYDVLDNGVIKSYAIEVDEATGVIKKMELSEYGLVNAMQSVNQAAKQHKELDNILSVDGSVNDQATILQNYLKKKQDLDDTVKDAWAKAQNNGGIIDGTDLDIIHAMSIEVRRLGDAIQSEYNKIFKLRESGGMFEALGSTGNTTEDRMKNYMQGYAYRNSKSVSSVQYDSATKTMTADLVDLSGAITKVKIQYNELFDGIQVSSSKGTQAVDETAKKINSLKSSLNNVSGFIDKNSQEAKTYYATLNNLNRIIDNFNNGTLSFNDANIAWWNKLRQAVLRAGDALLVTANNNKKASTKLNTDKTKQFGAFNKYNQDIKDAAYLTDSMKSDLADLETLLNGVSSAGDLDAWVDEFNILKKSISDAKEAYELSGGKQLGDITSKMKASFAQLDFKHDAQGLDAEQQAIADGYNKIQEEVNNASKAIKKGSKVDIAAIQNELDALTKLVDEYKDKHNIENASGSGRKKAPKSAQVDTVRNRYTALSNRANTDEFKDSEVIKKNLAAYTKAYNNLVDIQSKFKVGETLTQGQEDAFRQAQIECADYARELNRLMNASDKLVAQGENVRKLDVGEWDNRKSVLQDYVRELYGSSAAIGDFDKKFTKLLFTVSNGDGTFTNMSAVIDDARSKIVTLTGSTKEAVGGLAGFWNDLKGKFKSIGAYLVASLSFHEVWSVVRQGVAYVKEIDSALTELKKVTDETDASYDRFLQTMSKTAGKVGSTVSELTTMAADWARLGSITKSAPLYSNI